MATLKHFLYYLSRINTLTVTSGSLRFGICICICWTEIRTFAFFTTSKLFLFPWIL